MPLASAIREYYLVIDYEYKAPVCVDISVPVINGSFPGTVPLNLPFRAARALTNKCLTCYVQVLS